MTKINNKLFTIFLSFGIVFFVVTIYVLFISDLLPKTGLMSKHTITFIGLKIVKNNYFDTSLIKDAAVQQSGGIIESSNDPDFISLINLTDSVPYAISNSFYINFLSTPNTIEVTRSSAIPNSTMADKYKIRIFCGKKTIEEFSIGDLNTFLDLKSKRDFSTEKKEIKLVSKDKKVIAFANFIID